jgi:hypothetical protein
MQVVALLIALLLIGEDEQLEEERDLIIKEIEKLVHSSV